ncbi:single myb histone 6-like [Arachis stenosperma]|uniref:single myb histone 6-like n=1 Tax=Arachis stenosperma TaxID=217475 RepID=UPI0025AD7A7B|nr:single myb histone 6-like [Arachis stenosperma]
MWTLSEVIKLVDGISEYGVGRWTDIKRFSFSSSSYRTPIDLRDKWRNLLRASSIQTNTIDQKEDDQNDDHTLRPLPFNVACRVRELAKIHPYPRQRGGSKNSRSSKLGTSTSVSQSKDSPPICHSKRNIRRKCTYK